MWSIRAIHVLAILTLSFATVSCTDPSDGPSAIHDDGIELASEERWDDAVSAFTEVIELDPKTSLLVRAHLNRSIAFVELGRTEAAIADETAVISLASDEPLHASELVQAYLNRSRELGSLHR